MDEARLIDLFRALAREGVRYKVIGGIALNLHGLIRATEDRADAERLRREFGLEDE